jgi:hypothetical protein
MVGRMAAVSCLSVSPFFFFLSFREPNLESCSPLFSDSFVCACTPSQLFASLLHRSALSLGHLHFRYAWLLVFPRTLSAEYSFDCIPKV